MRLLEKDWSPFYMEGQVERLAKGIIGGFRPKSLMIREEKKRREYLQGIILNGVAAVEKAWRPKVLATKG